MKRDGLSIPPLREWRPESVMLIDSGKKPDIRAFLLFKRSAVPRFPLQCIDGRAMVSQQPAFSSMDMASSTVSE